MSRRLLNLLTALSLLLCVAVAALCVVSFWREDDVSLGGGRAGWVTVGSRRSGIELEWVRRYELRPDFDSIPEPHTFEASSTGVPLAEEYDFHKGYSGWDGWGWAFRNAGRFEAEKFDGVNGNLFGASDWTTAYRLAFPHWVAVLLLGAPPACAGVRRFRRRRRRNGSQCLVCGYDLRATPDCCPECGTPASVSTTG